jgi:hypothetical protein
MAHTNNSVAPDLGQNQVGGDAPVDIPAAAPSSNPAPSADDDRQFVAATVSQFGPTIRQLASGKTELNFATMSRLLARRLELAYDPLAHEFLLKRPDQTFEPIVTELVTCLISETLQQIAAAHPDSFPMKELRPARIRKLIDAIKLSVPYDRPDPQAVLLRFVRECLCLKPGGNATSAELYLAFQRFANKNALWLIPRAAFSRELARAVFRVFLKTPSNSVLRPVNGTTRLTCRHGFKGLVFADDPVNYSGDGRDCKDGKFTSEVLTNPS